jgi:hypothetical protein
MKRKVVTLEDLGTVAAAYGAARRAWTRIKRRPCEAAEPDEPPCLVWNRRIKDQRQAAEEGAADYPTSELVEPCPRCEALIDASATQRAVKRVLNGKLKTYLARCDRQGAKS